MLPHEKKMASKITELVFGRNRVSSLQNIQNDLMSSASSGYGGYECCDTGVDPAVWLTLPIIVTFCYLSCSSFSID